MRLVKIAKSRMSEVSERYANPIVAHLTPVGSMAPLCKARLPKGAHWTYEGEGSWAAVRDCRNCRRLARKVAR
jgi:hypothetical protein